MNFLSIYREINLDQSGAKNKNLNKVTGIIKFAQAKDRNLFCIS